MKYNDPLLFQPITDDDTDRISLCLRVLADRAPFMFDIFNNKCRESLSVMLAAKADEERETQRVRREATLSDLG